VNVKQIEDATTALREVGEMRWGGKLRKLAELSETSAKGKKVAQDYFFEFWCFIKAISAFKAIESTNAWKRAGPELDYAVWPLKPGDPENFSHYEFEYRDDVYCVHPGVSATPHSYVGDYAPDISIRQSALPESRGAVVAMWDAKYRATITSRLARSEVLTFLTERELLIADDPEDQALVDELAKNAQEAFQLSGLLTNGDFSTEDGAFLKTKKIQEVKSFGTSNQQEKRNRDPSMEAPKSTATATNSA